MGIEGIEGRVPSSSSSIHHRKYDLFASFRGEDIMKTFVAHLFRLVKRVGFCCFKDDDRVEVGILIDPNLLDAIRHSRVSLVVFTANYADSWWLGEA
ncbi:hypothetical protein NL676_015879 [Syzygium grande]|nr:hypothetical protein NL676_015879 [Syzygium grande]